MCSMKILIVHNIDKIYKRIYKNQPYSEKLNTFRCSCGILPIATLPHVDFFLVN